MHDIEGRSKTWTFFEQHWHEGNVPIMGPRTHAAWMCSCVFDGAFDGVTPDLDLHCARVNDSAKRLFLKPLVSTDVWVGLVKDGIARFDKNAALYIRPMYWAEKEGARVQMPDPDSTRLCLTIYEAPLREPHDFSITLSPFRRPTPETMPVDAKQAAFTPTMHARFSKLARAASMMPSYAMSWVTWRSSPPRTSSWSRKASPQPRLPMEPSWLGLLGNG